MNAGRPEPQPGQVPAADSIGSSPLAAAYGLVFTVLGCVGVSAGQILFVGDPAISASATGVIERCALKFPLSAAALGDLPDLSRCVAPAYRYQGLFVLGAAAVLVAAAAALIVIVPRADLRRLRRDGKRLAAMPGAKARFESLCDAISLTGRRRPRLVVPLLETHEPSTIAVPGRRMLIVVPVAIVTAQEGPDPFDAAVYHEMAHVRQGDASWVSCVRWIGWITIPAVILACLPDLLGSGTQVSSELLARAAALAVLSVVIAAWLLRRRELEADRQAAWWLGSPLPLRHLLETGLGHSPGHARWQLRLLAQHPSIPARIAALQDPGDLSDGGFGYALVTGVVAAMAMNASYYITWALDNAAGGWLPARVSAVVAGALIGFALTPSLIRRAARGRLRCRQAAWWRPAGTAAGILLGSAVAPATVPGATAVSLIPGLASRHAVIASLLTACAAAGITALAAGLATLAAERRLRPWWSWRTVGAALAISCCAAVALWPIPNLAVGGPVERVWLTFILPADRWRWLALAYPAMALLLIIRARPAISDTITPHESTSRRTARALETFSQSPHIRAAAALSPVCAAVAAATLFLPHSYPPPGTPAAAVLRAVEEQWWTITLAGWSVLVILALAAGIAGLARACVSAWVTCLLTGAGITAYGALTGHPGSLGTFASSVTTPSVWLFYLAVPTSCLALLHTGMAAAARKAWTLPAIAAAGAAAAAILVVSTGIPGLLVPLVPVPAPRPSPTPPVPSPHPVTPTPGSPAASQVLTKAAALHVISAAAAALPPGWLVSYPPSTSRSPGHVTIIPAACQPLADVEYLNVLPRPAVKVTVWFHIPPQSLPAGSETFSIEVESFRDPVPSLLLTAARQERSACRQFTATGSGGPVTFAVDPPDGQAPSSHIWRVDFTTMASGGFRGTSTWIVADSGHNLVLITWQTDVLGYQPTPDQPLIAGTLNAALSTLPRT